ncbi:TonB-dependent receptor [Winogradskyella sp. E313]|uniref:TonB-dependent receptor n=1 Tax=Winogradskyella immobilis TaxID=2816852 RepID=A0ABS8EP08_9FLAO|nr:TonB-dependent receptor [Winogradskyella immobilis]
MKIISFILLILPVLGFSQTIKGKVIDSDQRIPLENVSIINIQDNNITTSTSNGEFEISEGQYQIIKSGYKTKTITVKDSKYLIIELVINPSELNEIIINANQIPKALKKSVATIEILSKKDIDRSNDINISQVLNRTPGVFVQSGALNTNRFTIRGIGSRNLFGTSKIRAYFKDIPLTNGSGETTIEDFELGSISRIEVIKGATSSIYGAGLGGTIHLTPQNAYLNETSVNSQLTVGSFGLVKGTVNFNHGNTKNSYRGVYSNTHSDGYRDNNEYDRQTFTFSTNHYINNNNEISVLASYVDLKAFIPSSLNEDTFINNPTAAAFTWAQAQGFEYSKRGILGVTWNHQYQEKLKQVTSVFGSFRDAYEPRPFNILEENTFALGLRSRLLGKATLFNKPLNYTFGGEYFRDRYTSGTFENLFEDFPEGTGSVEGDRLSDFKENRSYFNLFFETNYEVLKNTSIVIGLNYNQTSYDLEDRFPVSDGNPDQSGEFNFDGILSPKIGLSHLISNDISLYGSVSQGFSPLSLEDTLLPDGQINTDLEPETGWNYEIGTRGSAFNNKLLFNLAIYRLDVRNLLVARRVAEDQFIGVNAGKTQHDGLELAVNYQWIDTEKFKLGTFLNYTLNDFTFEEFIDEDNDFSGNDLTGVPSEVFNAGIDISSKFGIYGNINFQHVGSQPITDSNSLFSDSYNLTNIKVGYKKELTKRITFNAFFGIDNVLDEVFASQILINASSFGGNAPRFFYPGNPINYYGGFNINYTF